MFEEIIPKLLNAKKIGIFTHVNPDGDALGSSYSLKLALTALGKKAEVFPLPNEDSSALELILGRERTGLSLEDCDLLAALDCADLYRLGEYGELFERHPNTVAIDHHVTHHPFAKVWTAPDISSTCEAMYRLYLETGIPLTREIAHNLYIGLATDTGNFKYSCVTSDTFRTAAALIETGIDFSEIARLLFTVKSREYYSLMQLAINGLQFFLDGKVCVMSLSQKDFESAGITESESTGIVTIPGSIKGVEIGVYIRKREENQYKISLRSATYANVAKIAEAFGGGGHIRASGYNAENTDESEIVEKLLVEIKKQL